MKHIIKIFIVLGIVLTTSMCVDNEVPYWLFITKGRVIDKDTKEPIEGINVIVTNFIKREVQSIDINPNVYRTSPPKPYGISRTDKNGKFQVREKGYRLKLQIAYRSDLYKDTIIILQDSICRLTDEQRGKILGTYTADVGDIELVKK